MIKANLFSGANPAIRFNLFLAKEARKRISTSIGAKKHQVCHFDKIVLTMFVNASETPFLRLLKAMFLCV
ncbi:hypothetical protein ASF10_07350 [Flavobacterium sp. Leaf82]|nr:hypothetical protein ASF10_07350 [Flavobacterium sp. Leaf82]